MIKEVSIKPWCIACKTCESICPSIFKVNWKSTVINKDYKKNIEKILQARDMCPVQVINVESENWQKLEIKAKKAVLKNKTFLTEDTLELVFEAKDFEFEPWQYVSLKMKDKIWNFSRSYSIARWTKESFTLTIKILEKWRWWEFLKNIKENSKLEFLWPTWEFLLKNTKNEKVFIVTWTWLAPAISMIESLDKNIKKTVIFWVRFEKDIYYKDILEKFENTNVIITVSKPSEWYTWKIWRVTDYLDKISDNAEFYICWNPEMVESSKQKLKEKWINEENVIIESFVSSPTQEKVWIIKDIFVNWNLKWIKIINWLFIIFWFLTPIIVRFWPESYYNTSWDIAWWSVFFVMAIRPIADLFPKYLIFRRLLVFRNWLWILSSSVILSHIWLNIYNNYVNFWTTFFDYLQNYFTFKNWSWTKIFPRLSEVTALLLFITSNNISQRILWVWWKRLQKLAYVYFLAWWIYIYSFWKNEALYSMIIVVILFFIALAKNIFTSGKS